MIDIKGTVIRCPQCGLEVDLAPFVLKFEKSEHSPTGDILSVLNEDGSIAVIDVRAKHTVNCKFYLNKAAVQILH